MKRHEHDAILEKAAKACDEFVERIEKAKKVTMRMQHHQGATYGAMICADLIRKMKYE